MKKTLVTALSLLALAGCTDDKNSSSSPDVGYIVEHVIWAQDPQGLEEQLATSEYAATLVINKNIAPGDSIEVRVRVRHVTTDDTDFYIQKSLLEPMSMDTWYSFIFSDEELGEYTAVTLFKYGVPADTEVESTEYFDVDIEAVYNCTIKDDVTFYRYPVYDND